MMRRALQNRPDARCKHRPCKVGAVHDALERSSRPGANDAFIDGDRMSKDSITVVAPATLSNLGSGFDVFGLALREPFDIIEVRRTSEKGVLIEKIEGRGAGTITLDARKNSSGVAAAAVLEQAKADFGLALSIKKGIRPCSGIGSSGASAAGGAFAANCLLDQPLRPESLVYCAAKAEQATSGSFHADNVGPSVMGGFTIIKSYDPFEILRADPPANLGVVVTMPEFLVNTKEARKVLPLRIELKSMIYQVGNASALTLGMLKGDVELVGNSMKDLIVEPARTHLNPHLKEAETAAMKAGACGAFLGGSGPCVIAIFNMDRIDGKAIAESVQKVYSDHGLKSDVWITTWGEGCRRQ
jgi:homoserine kinase